MRFNYLPPIRVRRIDHAKKHQQPHRHAAQTRHSTGEFAGSPHFNRHLNIILQLPR